VNKVLNFGRRLERFAMRPIEQDKKINLLVGSVRSGKTWSCIPKILALCEYKVAGRRLITGVSKASIKTNVLSDLFNIIGPQAYKYNTQSGELKLFGADWLVYGAHDEGSEKVLRGSTIGAAVCDEVVLMPQNYWQMLLTRLSPPGARLYGTTNADTASHWLKTGYLDNVELKDILWCETYTMDDNPNLDAQFIEDQKKLYTGVFYDRMILGRWSNPSGACYAGAWGPWTVYDDDSRPRGLYSRGGREGWKQHLVGCDYGTHNPTVYLDALDDGTTLWIDNELYYDPGKVMQHQRTDAEHAAALQLFMGDSPAAQDRPCVLVDPSAASFREELTRRQVWHQAADNEVLDGIRRTGSALKQRKLRVHKRCVNTIREMENYAWDEKAIKRGGDEAPLKVADHAPDAVRYLVNAVFKADWRLAA
jgi:PBSX family phage terminase large subunit